MTTRAAVAACCCCSSSSSSSVSAGRGRGGRVVAAASSAIAVKPSRVPRVRALSRLQLHSVDARRSHRFYEAASQGSKADRGAPMRAAVGGDGKGEGDDSTRTTTPPSTSSPSSSQKAQEQRDLDLIRRAQANDAGTTYPLEEAKVGEGHQKKTSQNRVARSKANSSSHRLNLDLLDLARTKTKTLSQQTATGRYGDALGHRRPRLRLGLRAEAPGVHGVRNRGRTFQSCSPFSSVRQSSR